MYLLFLHLRFLLDLQSSPTVLPSLLAHAVEAWSPPLKDSRLIKVFWWRWAESNRRPTCLHIEGITTILLFTQLTLDKCLLPVCLFGLVLHQTLLLGFPVEL